MLASLLFMKRMSETVSVGQQGIEVLSQELKDEVFKLPPKTVVYTIEGPFFFGAAERLESLLASVHSHADLLVIRLHKVPFIDATGLNSILNLIEICKRDKTRLVLSEPKPNVYRKFQLNGIVEKIGPMNVISSLNELSFR